MTTGALIFALASLATVVLLFVALPEMSRPTVPLGVSVPSGRVADPVVPRGHQEFPHLGPGGSRGRCGPHRGDGAPAGG